MTYRQEHYFWDPILKNQTIWPAKTILLYRRIQGLQLYWEVLRPAQVLLWNFYRFYRTPLVAASNTCLGKTTTFCTVSLPHCTPKTQFSTFAPGSIFSWEMLFIGLFLLILKIKLEFFLLPYFFSIYADHAFLAIRAKYPSCCHFETIYQSINVMKHDFFQCIRSEIVKKGK